MVMRLFRCGVACMVALPMWTAALDAASAPAPAFTDGHTSWFTGTVVRANVEKLPNECERRFGQGVETDIEPAPGSRLQCDRMESGPMPLELIKEFEKVATANRQLRPTKQKSDEALWTQLLSKPVTADVCPKGMRLEQFPDPSGVSNCSSKRANWDYCEKWAPKLYVRCIAFLEHKEFCPKGDLSLIDRACYRRTCPDEFRALEAVTGVKGLPGCFKCDKGVFDLDETLAAEHTTVRSLQFTKRPLNTVLCRVGPRRATEADKSVPKKKSKRG